MGRVAFEAGDPVMRHKMSPLTVAMYLSRDLAKMRHVFTLTFYLMCISLFAILLAVHRVSFYSSAAPLYYSNRAHDLLSGDAFLRSKTFNDFFPWLRSATASAIKTTNGPGANRFMSTVQLRQIRLVDVDCGNVGRFAASMDPLTQLMMFNNSCVGDPVDDYAPTFGAGRFPLRSTTGLSGFEHTADFHDLGVASREYVVTLDLSNGTMAQIDRVEAGGWIDRFTSCLCVDFVVYNSDSTLLVVSSYVLERTTTGLFDPQTMSGTFSFFSGGRGLIAMDAFIFMFAFILLSFLILDVRERYALQMLRPNASMFARVRRVVTSVGIWELFTAALIGCIVTVTGLRFRLWSVSQQIDANGGTDAYNFAVSAFNQYDLIYRLYCVSLVLAAFRLFYSFRYIAGLSKITNALRRTSKDLARVGVVYAVLLGVFTISGCLLYGESLRGMRTFFNALAYLLVMLVSASLDDGAYNVMRQNAGFLTDVYLVFIFLIFWLLMMNLAVAIISSAFLNYNDADELDTDNVWELITIYVTFTHAQYYEVDRLAQKSGEGVAVLPASRRLAHSTTRRLVPLRQRLLILKELRDWRMACYLEFASRAVTGRQEMSLLNALELCAGHQSKLGSSHFSGETLLYRLFRDDQRVSGALKQSVQEASDMQVRIMHRLSALQRSINNTAAKQRGDGARLASSAVTAVAAGAGGVSVQVAPAVGRVPAVASAPADVDAEAAVGMARLSRTRQRRRAASIASEKSFSIGEEGDVAELDSASDVASSSTSTLDEVEEAEPQRWPATSVEAAASSASAPATSPASSPTSILKTVTLGGGEAKPPASAPTVGAQAGAGTTESSRPRRRLRFADAANVVMAVHRFSVAAPPGDVSPPVGDLAIETVSQPPTTTSGGAPQGTQQPMPQLSDAGVTHQGTEQSSSLGDSSHPSIVVDRPLPVVDVGTADRVAHPHRDLAPMLSRPRPPSATAAATGSAVPPPPPGTSLFESPLVSLASSAAVTPHTSMRAVPAGAAMSGSPHDGGGKLLSVPSGQQQRRRSSDLTGRNDAFGWSVTSITSTDVSSAHGGSGAARDEARGAKVAPVAMPPSARPALGVLDELLEELELDPTGNADLMTSRHPAAGPSRTASGRARTMPPDIFDDLFGADGRALVPTRTSPVSSATLDAAHHRPEFDPWHGAVSVGAVPHQAMSFHDGFDDLLDVFDGDAESTGLPLRRAAPPADGIAGRWDDDEEDARYRAIAALIDDL